MAGGTPRRAGRLAAAQWWRLRMLLWDTVRVATGAARTLAWTATGDHRTPGLARLEGEAVARVGQPATYRIRIHNPGAQPARVQVTVRGWCTGVDRGFTVAWDTTLGGGASAEQRVSTTWEGTATLDAMPATPGPASVPAAPPRDRWTVECRLVAAGPHGPGDRLTIGGELG